MKLAAIDIGTNAIRLQIVTVFEEENKVSFKKLEFLRFPLRLGLDVFKKGSIRLPTLEKLNKLMHTFKLLIELYEVEAYTAVATSAMREAKNREEVQDYISNHTGIQIDIISGHEEADILNQAITPYIKDGTYLHVDVGGGSTELNVYENRQLKANQSFKIGSVRKLSRTDREKTFAAIAKWIKRIKLNKKKSVTGIGTGGNINKLFKLSNQSSRTKISLTELKALRAYVKTYSYEDRMAVLKMNPDRADVIVPASEIYIKVLEQAGSDHILVPKVGLKDGLIYNLYAKVSNKAITEIEFLEEF